MGRGAKIKCRGDVGGQASAALLVASLAEAI